MKKTPLATWLATSMLATLAAFAGPACAQTAAPQAAQTRAQGLFGDVNPKLAQLTDDVLFGDVWKRPGLSPRDRSLVTVSALIAMNRPDQLRSHLQLARTNGLTEAELVEAITHLAFYAGWPSGVAQAWWPKRCSRRSEPLAEGRWTVLTTSPSPGEVS